MLRGSGVSAKLERPEGGRWSGRDSPLEGSTDGPTVSTVPDHMAPIVYGGWIRSSSHLSSLRRTCDKRRMSLLVILPTDIQASDQHMLGPICWWPERGEGEGGPRKPESVNRGRLTVWHHIPASQTADRHLSIPDFLSAWPLLFRDHPSIDNVFTEEKFLRPSVLVALARMLRSGPKGSWWWPEEEGALGQALHTGLWTNSHGSSVAESMPRKEGAQLYATAYWNRSVLLASVMHCREVVATRIHALDLPTISPALSKRLYQHANVKPNKASPEADHHGWEGSALRTVNLATVTDPVTGLRGDPFCSAKTTVRTPTCHATAI